ncbi:MAG: FAD-dependent thymidylate synthase [Oscillospiraceae bacterium]|jgi:thymidylate synthase (FAD)|nr:FAD-dependent thymidylate synthase [Oscillospiraceae bacterium]
MRIIEPSFTILTDVNEAEIVRRIERAARVCYKSEDMITDDSAPDFVRRIIKSGHESVIEHESVSVLVVCDRGVSHEWVRHRIASYSQESTRYCNYGKDKFGGEIAFIKPRFWNEDGEQYRIWLDAMRKAEDAYLALLRLGASPQQARGVLPNSLKTELVVTMNLREWRHFFRLRVDKSAHPQMRELAKPMLAEFKRLLPCVFGDIFPAVG